MIFYNKFSNSRSKCKLRTCIFEEFAFMIDFEINYIHDMTRRSNGQILAEPEQKSISK